MIKKNDAKILEFVQSHDLFSFSKVDLKGEVIFAMIDDESLALKEKVVSFCLLSLNFDWISSRFDNMNILQLLVKKQRSGCLVQLFKALSGKIPPQVLTNKFVKQLSP